jgi:putative membrane protein
MFRSASFPVSLVIIAAVAGPALAMGEKEFITDAIKGDNSEITLGQLAVSKAATPALRSFGQTLVADHTLARTEAEAVAKELGVSPPAAMTAEAEQELAKLKGMSGSDFDKEFASYMVKDHETDISKFKTEASAGKGPASELAQRQLPTLEKHLHMAQTLQSAAE